MFAYADKRGTNHKQDGNVYSRRYMSGSRSAKFLKTKKKQFLRTKNHHLEKFHYAENCREGPFGLFQHPFSCKKSNKNDGGPLETLVNIGKNVSKSRKKIERGEHLVSSGFVVYVKTVKNERRTSGDI